MSKIPRIDLDMAEVRRVAREFAKANPELFNLYEKQKQVNPNLDQDVEEWSTELDETNENDN